MESTMAFQSTTQVTETASVLTVPDIQPYFPRVHSGKTEEEILKYAQSTQQAVLFTGPAGTGKTSSARHYAATHQLPFVVIECTQQVDQTVTQGRFVPTADGQVRWLDSQLATAIQQPSVILFNELTRMSPKAASLFLRLLQERELAIEPLNKVIKVHPDCLIIADQNTGYGYTGTSKQDAALIDRFNLKVEFEYDTEIEKHFIKSPALLAFADGIRVAAKTADEFSVPMSTRVLINFQAQAQALGFEFAVNSLLNNFPKSDGERDGIKMRLDADAFNIASELGVQYESYDAN
jgi:MoxR-like ATPase